MKQTFVLFLAGISSALAAPDGKELYEKNCAACHLVNQMVVGPSLVEIRNLYYGRPDDFVKWAVAPYKKRPHSIYMPSMVHVGEEGLKSIYNHVIKISKDKAEKISDPRDPFLKSPTLTARPQVQRIFMPESGPASIAVALDEKTSLCWDAGNCRLRYSWTGGFIDGFPYWKGNGSQQATIIGDVRYTENEALFGKGINDHFKGYRLQNGLPIFQYQAGNYEISESYAPVKNQEGFIREFQISSNDQAKIQLKIGNPKNVSILSNKGKIEDGILHLSAQEALNFRLTYLFP